MMLTQSSIAMADAAASALFAALRAASCASARCHLDNGVPRMLDFGIRNFLAPNVAFAVPSQGLHLRSPQIRKWPQFGTSTSRAYVRSVSVKIPCGGSIYSASLPDHSKKNAPRKAGHWLRAAEVGQAASAC
jgi:hypothetical protein